MESTIQRIAAVFSRSLVQSYSRLQRNDIDPKEYPRLNSALIFAALEASRGVCATTRGLSPRDVWCRYTLGHIAQAKKADIKAVLNRVLNPSLPETPDHLSEFAFDFSFSTRNIEDAVTEPGTSAFAFILVAESELRNCAKDILRDLLKLVAAAAPIKVMIYRSNVRGVVPRIQLLLNACARGACFERSWHADWLFLAVPTYIDWLASGSIAQLKYSVHSIPPASKPLKLENHDSWWDIGQQRSATFSGGADSPGDQC